MLKPRDKPDQESWTIDDIIVMLFSHKPFPSTGLERGVVPVYHQPRRRQCKI